jgi:hypothetical protein
VRDTRIVKNVGGPDSRWGCSTRPARLVDATTLQVRPKPGRRDQHRLAQARGGVAHMDHERTAATAVPLRVGPVAKPRPPDVGEVEGLADMGYKWPRFTTVAFSSNASYVPACVFTNSMFIIDYHKEAAQT